MLNQTDKVKILTGYKMGKTGNKGIKRIYNAIFYSMNGFQAAWEKEAAFRQEVIILIFLVPLAFILGATALEKAVLISSWLIVIITELVNSAMDSASART